LTPTLLPDTQRTYLTPIEYLKNIKLQGELFEDNCTSGAISCVYTKFCVDHTEPLEALQIFRQRGGWCLGELLDGHEFLIILPILEAVKVGGDIFA
jgi:hypothetical protein